MWAVIVLALVCAARAAVIVPVGWQEQPEVPVWAGQQDEQGPWLVLRDMPTGHPFQDEPQPHVRYDKFGECNHGYGGGGGGYQQRPCPYRKWPCDPYYIVY